MKPITKTFATIGVVVLAAGLLLGLIIGGYDAGWWFKNNSTQRQAHLNRSSFEAQATYRDEVERQISNIAAIDTELADPSLTSDQRAALAAQKVAVVTQACDIASRIVGGDVPSTITSFVASSCH